MAKQTLEIDIEAMIERSIGYALNDVVRADGSWVRSLEEKIRDKIVDRYIQLNLDAILEKIDQKTLADMVAQRTALEIARGFVSKGLH